LASLPGDNTSLAGTRIGRYEIVRPLASGGMGEVFLARATAIGGFSKSVALKRLRPELAVDPAFVAMFLDEARIAATLDHSNIVQVVDVLLEGGTAWIVMEYLRGADVGELVRLLAARGQTFPVGAAVAIAITVADALHYAHERGDDEGKPLEIVHRDVSPGNILVTLDGTVKVIDFGIARANARATETAVGTIKGKLLFMSPEQCRGERIDRRSDVFSLGVTLFEMLTGTLPHGGADEYEIQKSIVEGAAPVLSTIIPALPAEIDALVAGCIAKRPADRPKHAGALAAALLGIAESHGWDLSPFGLARLVKAAERLTDVHAAEPPHRSSVTFGASVALRADRSAPVSAAHGTTAAQGAASVPVGGRRVALWSLAPIVVTAAAAGLFIGRSSAPDPPAASSSVEASKTGSAQATTQPETQPEPAPSAAKAEAASTAASVPSGKASSSSSTANTSRARTTVAPKPKPNGARLPPDPDAPLPR